ncbi:MAG: dethiobiotin synthase [Gammaproteobacteria bacterium]|nr:dethiobiotin synthase [Gammaproteobacteria bacterium]
MKYGYFITGTDTGAGKTRISTALLAAFNARGFTTAAMKPVATGCFNTIEGLRNDDALRLQQHASLPLSYEQINPYAFAPAIAPHLAAEQAGRVIDMDRIKHTFGAVAVRADVVIVEGVGGWLVPLNRDATIAGLAKSIGLPVILVVAIRLGCLNHALLSTESIEQSDLPFAGWIANLVDPAMLCIDENIEALRERIAAPWLGSVPWNPQATATEDAQQLRLPLRGANS